MKGKGGVWFVITVFYLAMLLISAFGRKIHMAGLPTVNAMRTGLESFSEEVDGQIATKMSIGVPISWYDNPDGRFMISQEMVNGELRNIARQVHWIEIGLNNEESYEVKDGVGIFSYLIIDSSEELEDGMEVLVNIN